MTYFVIRQIETGLLFPAHAKGTWAEFGPGQPPRLFIKIGAAKNCLTAWLAGRQKRTWHKNPDTWMGGGEVYEDWDCDPDPSRVREDYEIVEVAIVDHGKFGYPSGYER